MLLRNYTTAYNTGHDSAPQPTPRPVFSTVPCTLDSTLDSTPVADFELGDSEYLCMTEMRDMVSSHSRIPSGLEFDAPEHIIYGSIKHPPIIDVFIVWECGSRCGCFDATIITPGHNLAE